MSKRKRYLVTAENSEAFACSLVTDPAVEELFVAFKEEKPIVEKFADEKKHMITGVVAIPNKPIYRRDADGEEYDIVFSADAIESMSKKFMKDFRQKNVTLQHEEDADGIYMVEQWIKTDLTYDKSLSLGFSREIPVGTWFQTYYVDSNDIWQRITSGELRGFSLECVLGVEELFNKQNENTMIDTNEENFWTKLKSILSEAFNAKKEEVTEQIETMESELEEQTPTEPIEEPQVEPTVEEPIDEPTVEEKPSEEPIEVDEGVQEGEGTIIQKEEIGQEEFIPNTPNPLEELIKNLNDEIKALKESNASLQEKISGLEKQPSANPIKPNAKPNAGDTYTAWREKMRSML